MKSEACWDSSTDHTPVLLTTISTMIVKFTSSHRMYGRYTDWESSRKFLGDKLDFKVCLKTSDESGNATKDIQTLLKRRVG